jgi:hypothetical protein
MSERKIGKHPALAASYGVDLASKPDKVSLAIMDPKDVQMVVDRDDLNARCASRKADREFIARALIGLMERHGAQVERRDDGPNPGYRGASICLRFTLNGVGAMLDIDNLHGGDWSLIHWHNTKYPTRNFTSRFCVCVGEHGNFRPHHKATSQPADWYSLAMMLDAGLMLAARGQAFAAIE